MNKRGVSGSESYQSSGKPLDQMIRSSNSILIKNVTLFDGEKISNENQDVLVFDGFIEEVAPHSENKFYQKLNSSQEIDGDGGFLMPGLMDSEAHIVPPYMYQTEFSHDNERVCEKGIPVKPNLGEVYRNLLKKDLLKEKNFHGHYYEHDKFSGGKGKQPGGEYPISEYSMMEKHHRFGVTTIFDMHGYPSLINTYRRSRGMHLSNQDSLNPEERNLKKEFLLYPDTFTSGSWAIINNLEYFLFGVSPIYNHWGEGEFQKWVDDRVSEGSDYIKVYWDDKGARAGRPKIKTETLKKLVQVAQGRGLQVIAHSLSLRESGILASVSSDVSPSKTESSHYIAHGTIHSGVRDLGEESKFDYDAYAKGVKFNVPTIGVLMAGGCYHPYGIANRLPNHKLGKGGFVENYFRSHKVLPFVNSIDHLRLMSCSPSKNSSYAKLFQHLAKLADHGILLLAGTDSAGAEPAIEGVSVHYEGFLISEAMKFRLTKSSGYVSGGNAPNHIIDGLKSMTSNAAISFGLHREKAWVNKGYKVRENEDPRGFIKSGYRADLLLLNSDPRENILNTLDIRKVWKAGYALNRDPVRPKCGVENQRCESLAVFEKIEKKACR